MFVFAAVEHTNGIFAFFENNLFNWVVLIAFLGWLWMKYMPGVFASRKTDIESALSDAAKARAEGQAFLEEQKKRVASAEQESDNILAEALQVANEMRQQMQSQTAKELADLSHRIEQEIAAERQMVISQLRTAAARAAIKLTEAALPGAITDSARSRLLDQFLGELEVVNK